MSAGGKYSCASEAAAYYDADASEPLPDPKEAFREALASRAAWLRQPDLDVIFGVLDDESLTICWRP